MLLGSGRYAVPHSEDNEDQRQSLGQRFGVNSLPTLIILDPEFNVVNANGRSALASDLKGENFPWAPQAFNILHPGTLPEINSSPFLVVMLEDQDAVNALGPILEKVTKAEEAKAKAAGSKSLRVLLGDIDGQAAGIVKDFCRLEDEAPLVQDTLLSWSRCCLIVDVAVV
jgi:nucleoredoxin